jgi:Fe-S cluster assembly protein SufD
MSVVVRIDPKTSIFRNDFASNHADLPGAMLPWLSSRRAAAIDAFASVGAPTKRVEAWKYTDIAGALDSALEPATEFRGKADEADPFVGLGVPRLTLINGFLQSHDDVEGLEIVNLGALQMEPPQWVSGNLGLSAADSSQALGAASLALMRGGVAIRVTGARKIHLAFINPLRGAALMSHARVLIVVEEGAALDLLESHAGAGDEHLLANLGMEIVLKANAHVSHTRLQAEGEGTIHVTSLAARLERDASYYALYAAVGAKLSRLDANIRLGGPGAAAELRSVSVLGGTRHADITTVMDHASHNTMSKQLFKSVVGGRGRTVAQGRVTVREGAVKSDSHQLFKAMLLGARAEADAKPELEIYADDVSCGHGTAIGAIDPDALFYMRARGIDETEARSLLVRAFLEDAIQGFADDSVHDALWAKIDAALPALQGETP